MTMRYSTLGRTALRVSTIGFGAATLGDEYGALSPAAGRLAVEVALDLGINFFDVSPYYGRTVAETRLGEALEGKRQSVVLATKVGRYDRDMPEGFDFSATRVMRSLEESLRRLRTDYLDLFLVHDVEFAPREVILGETLPAMRRLQEQGKVRHLGITGYPLELLRDLARADEVDVVMSYCHHNLLNSRLESVLAPVASARGIGVVNASPLHMGALTHDGPPPWHPAPAFVLRAARQAAEWCAARGADLADVALRFALGTPTAGCTLVGMRTEAEVRRNVYALEGGERSDPEVLSAVRDMLAPVQDVEWASGLAENNDPALLRGAATLSAT
jgi:L-galactose dehydrogenase